MSGCEHSNSCDDEDNPITAWNYYASSTQIRRIFLDFSVSGISYINTATVHALLGNINYYIYSVRLHINNWHNIKPSITRRCRPIYILYSNTIYSSCRNDVTTVFAVMTSYGFINHKPYSESYYIVREEGKQLDRALFYAEIFSTANGADALRKK